MYMTLAICLYSAIFGLRYGVGADFFQYMDNYNALLKSEGSSTIRENYEFGFLFLYKLLASTGFHSSFFFTIFAFLQVYLTVYVLKKSYQLYPFFVLTFMLGCTWLTYCNGLRQIFAFNLIAVSLLFYGSKKNVLVHYLLIILAISFHKSAAIAAIFYPLFLVKEEWFRNVTIQIIVFIISLFLRGNDFVQDWVMTLERYTFIYGYDTYFGKSYEFELYNESAVHWGIGTYVLLLINGLMIIFSTRVKSFFANRYVNIIYNLYFIGVIIGNIFVASHVIMRVNYYFY